MRLEIRAGDAGWTEIAPLFAVVYPPDVLATIVWRGVTWAHADRWVLIYREARLVSAVGMYRRDGLHGDAPVRIGGIGGVMTHPDERGRGGASAALRQAHSLFREDGADFSLLFCEAKNIGFYRRLDWRVFAGEVIVEQPGGRGPFSVMGAMVRSIRSEAPAGGTIDLCGLPW
jgi:aminoglycoside 2'-N-acetyltransferase I